MIFRLSPLHWVWRHARVTLPYVDRELQRWHRLADSIPEDALRYQAQASLSTKQFHCDGGSVFATWLLPDNDQVLYEDVLRFIVAFQTISDYLDNLCDRAGSLSERNFRRLHRAMFAAVGLEDALGPDGSGYYAYHSHRHDGAYLAKLIDACRSVVRRLPGFSYYASRIERFLTMYIDIQVRKHGALHRRVSALTAWFSPLHRDYPQFSWWELAAAAGSTLGIFAFIAEAARGRPTDDRDQLGAVYFPWMGALHILLDYLIDQREDQEGDDLNFITFYPSRAAAAARLDWVLTQLLASVRKLRAWRFHVAVVEGLLGTYLSDPKVAAQGLAPDARILLRRAGWRSPLVYAVCRRVRRVRYEALQR